MSSPPNLRCPTCGQPFANAQSMAAHRVGSYLSMTRTCLSGAQMRANGFTFIDHAWRARPSAQFSRIS